MNISAQSKGLKVPETFSPEGAQIVLPEPTADDLRRLKVAGWARFGAIAAIFDPKGRVLMLEHKAADKTPEGALGPLAETAQLARTEAGITVEKTAHTFARAIHEELGIPQPNSLGLRAAKLGAWTLNDWPVGVNHDGEHALAICPVAYIASERQEKLLDTFVETEEIKAITFMDPKDVVTQKLVRPGTVGWIQDVMASSLAAADRSTLASVRFPSPQPLPGGIDAKMTDIAWL